MPLYGGPFAPLGRPGHWRRRRTAPAAADTLSLGDLATLYQTMLDEGTAIQGRMDAITAGPASPTAAQTGTALKTLAGDVKRLAIAQARVLKALRVLVRRAGT